MQITRYNIETIPEVVSNNTNLVYNIQLHKHSAIRNTRTQTLQTSTRVTSVSAMEHKSTWSYTDHSSRLSSHWTNNHNHELLKHKLTWSYRDYNSRPSPHWSNNYNNQLSWVRIQSLSWWLPPSLADESIRWCTGWTYQTCRSFGWNAHPTNFHHSKLGRLSDWRWPCWTCNCWLYVHRTRSVQ